MELIINGDILITNSEGFLSNFSDWSDDVAVEIATLNAIKLTPLHWEIVRFIQIFYQRYKHLPNARVFTKAIRKEFGEEKGNSRYLYKLFPQGPLKYACKIAGLPKPPTCL